MEFSYFKEISVEVCYGPRYAGLVDCMLCHSGTNRVGTQWQEDMEENLQAGFITNIILLNRMLVLPLTPPPPLFTLGPGKLQCLGGSWGQPWKLPGLRQRIFPYLPESWGSDSTVVCLLVDHSLSLGPSLTFSEMNHIGEMIFNFSFRSNVLCINV